MESKEQPPVQDEQAIEVEHWETDTEFMDENGNPIRVEGDSQPMNEDVDLKTAVAGMISDIAKDVKDGKDIDYSKYGDPDEDVSRHYNVKGVSNKEYKKSKKKNKNFDDMSDY
jgi:Zn-finger nucleic acid-binding protein